MIGALAGAGVGLIQAIMSANAAREQAEIQRQALQETKRTNRKTERLQRSDRGDPYGNVVRFTEGLGFGYDLTPITQAILAAEQRETKANLEQDAPRNRAAAVRMDDRSKMGDEEFEKAFNEYRYRAKPSKAAAITDATDLLLRGRKKGLDESANLVARQLMRTGGSSQLASVYKQSGDMYADTLAEAMLKGKQIGTDNYNSELAAAPEKNELAFLKSIADNTTTSPVAQSGINQQLSGRADNALSGLTAAIESGRGAASADAARYAQAAGATAPDLSGIISALSSMKMGGQQQQRRDPYEQPMDPWTKWLTTTQPMRL